MATWRPNDVYGPGGGEFVDDSGQIWPDPWGALAPAASGGAPAPLAAVPTAGQAAGGFGGTSTPDLSNIPDAGLKGLGWAGAPVKAAQQQQAAGNVATAGAAADARTAAQETAEGPPAAMQGEIAGPLPSGPPAAAGGAPAPEVAGPLPPEQPAAPMPPSTMRVTEGEESSTGLDAASAERTGADIDASGKAMRAAGDAQDAFTDQQAKIKAARAAQMLAKATRDIEEQGAEMAVQWNIEDETNRKLAAGADWRPDRAELFGGDLGVAFGLTAAVAAMAGAWMQGRGISQNNPYLPTIMKMIDDNVNDQVRKNSGVMAHLREIKGDTKAAMAELKERQFRTLKQQLDAYGLKDESDIQQAGRAVASKTVDAEIAKANADQRKALNRSVTKKVSTRVMANPAFTAAAKNQFPSRLAARRANDSQFIHEWKSLKSQLQAAQKSGATAGYLGTVATHGVNWVQHNLNGLPPEQQQVAIMMARLEELNHLHTGSSMVGLSAEEKERFGKVGVPEKERDLSNTYSYFDTLAREKEDQIKGNYGAGGDDGEEGHDGGDDEPVGAF